MLPCLCEALKEGTQAIGQRRFESFRINIYIRLVIEGIALGRSPAGSLLLMLLSIQFPFCDSRPFLPSGDTILDVPQWPAPTPDSDFVRGFGIVKRRRLGG